MGWVIVNDQTHVQQRSRLPADMVSHKGVISTNRLCAWLAGYGQAMRRTCLCVENSTTPYARFPRRYGPRNEVVMDSLPSVLDFDHRVSPEIGPPLA